MFCYRVYRNFSLSVLNSAVEWTLYRTEQFSRVVRTVWDGSADVQIYVNVQKY